MTRASFLATGLVIVVTLGACSSYQAPPPRSSPVPTAVVTATPTPRPVVFPRDDAPHDALTEWWYYTGHLETAEAEQFGFELVFFQSVRGRGPVGYAAHFAVTDASRDRFAFDQRTDVGSQIGATDGFDLTVGGWHMAGAGGRDRLSAEMPGYALDLRLVTTKPPVLHGDAGVISFGPAGDSYYYSRTRLTASGTLTVGDRSVPVTGMAWFDHQWGNFISAGGGWDWFSVQLEDHTELTGSVVRDDAGRPILIYGTYVDRDGQASHLDAEAFRVTSTDTWTSPSTGATYPSRWRVSATSPGIELELIPVLPDQELDTRATTGVIYWEGAVTASGTKDGRPIAGKGYVELTGYPPGLR